MIKKKFIKILLILFLFSGCGYTPIYSNKNYNFSILDLKTTGNSMLNQIIENKLKGYKNSNAEKQFNLIINTNIEKKIVSKDSKGNPKIFRIVLKSKIIVSATSGTEKEKSFSKTLDYNNRSKKSELKSYENEVTKNLAEKISEEIIIYLVSS
tara:strand:+ start:598 stop:1056 length:459 start_codon:yes stop_codon:yes gene_type:complete